MFFRLFVVEHYTLQLEIMLYYHRQLNNLLQISAEHGSHDLSPDKAARLA
jgi:hypothetical protein